MKPLYFISKNFILTPHYFYKGDFYKNYALSLRENNGIEVCYFLNYNGEECYVTRNQSVYILDQEKLNNITPEIVKSLFRYKNKCHKDLRNLIEKYNMFI
jgi:hypothetical protein